jgi:ATPase subunit of ABC transporter with duplicated ATPase domains
MMGIEEPNEGTVTLPRKVGFLKQNIEDFKDQDVISVVIMGNKRLWKPFKSGTTYIHKRSRMNRHPIRRVGRNYR